MPRSTSFPSTSPSSTAPPSCSQPKCRRTSGDGLLRHLVLVALLGVLLVLATGCEIVKPELPTFATAVTVPFGDQRVDMAEVVAEQDYLVDDPVLGLAVRVEGDPEPLPLAYELVADLAATGISAGLGAFPLSSGAPLTSGTSLAQLYPGAEALDGTTAPIPAFTYDLSGEAIALEDITSASVHSGELQVSLFNGLAIPVSGSALPEQVLVRLVDPATGLTLIEVSFPETLPAGTTTVAQADLAGIRLPGQVIVHITGGSPGSPTPVLIEADAQLTVTAELRDLLVDEAEAVIEAQTIQTEVNPELPVSYQIAAAQIISGTVDLSLVNEMAIPCQVNLSCADFLDRDDLPLQASIEIPAHTTRTHRLDLGGGRVQSADDQLLDALPLSITVTSPGSDGSIVTLRASDGLRATVAPTTIRLGAVTGIIPALSFDLEPWHEEISLPEELVGINLTAASLVLTVANSARMPAQLDVTLTGTNAGGAAHSLELNHEIAAAQERGPESTVVVFDESNSEIVSLLNSLPTSLTLTGQMTVGGEGLLGSICPEDTATVAWRVESPVRMIIDHAVLAGDPAELDLSEDTRDAIRDNLLGAHMTTRITNHFPFGAEIRLLVGQDPETITSHPSLIVGPLLVAGGQLDPVTGAVAQPTVSQPEIEISLADAAIFAEPNMFTMVEVTLPGTDGIAVRVRASDYLQVTGIARLDLIVEDE